jgi:hypothetical protein
MRRTWSNFSRRLICSIEHLTAVETDAKAKGYNLIARKAAIARG